IANGTKLHEIVMNLCTNAAHAMNEKGILTIGYTEKMFTEEFRGRMGVSSPGFYSVISVIDNGIGIPEHVLSHIFEPYYTTKPVGEGTGMGLAVVFGIVMDHGGNIQVYSTPGKGTEFRIMLPKSDSEPIAETKESRRICGGNERILFVDDEVVLCEMFKEMLTNLGYKVSVCTDSKEAFEVFRQSPHDFDLVITDQTMPELTGLELSEMLLQIRKNIPVILCTGYSKLVDKQSAHRAGIKAFCTKPLRMNDIAYHIRLILDKS
ncbi:MAG: ATP-binding protein, partial [Chitinivibrionales bacterium]